MEHHSNFVPWQYVAGRTGAEFAVIPVDENGELQLDELDAIAARGNVKVLGCAHVSNSLGSVNPIERLIAWGHEQGAIVVVDGAQAVPHRAVDVQALGADFYAFTGHKMCAPTGIGVLWGRAEHLEAMSPFELGGHMIRKVTVERTTWNELPHKFEAGTAPIAEAVGLGAAIDYLGEIGLEAIERHERDLLDYTLPKLEALEGVRVFGPPADRRGRRRAPARRRAGAGLGGRRRPGGPPLQPAADGEAGRAGDDAGELLPLHGSRGDRPARCGYREGT
jgi:cysteine desulfurase/selenocysteine lyase